MSRKKIGIVYNEPVSEGQAFYEASRDILTQVEAIEHAVEDIGYASVRLLFSSDLSRFIQKVQQEKADMVFNLCETVDETPSLAGHPAAVLELIGIPFSGSSSAALMLTTDKLVTKYLLKANGIRTPNCVLYDGSDLMRAVDLRFPVIVKPRFEDASIGIDQESIILNEKELRRTISKLFERFGILLIEEYIAGREFNISLFGYPSPSVLPVAEIDFSELPQGLYHIVGYRAKWDRESFEYHHTPRKFPQDLPKRLRTRIERTASQCFQLFTLSDYGRIDMRVDAWGRIYVIEVNANPCLSPDAGLPAAVQHAGMTYHEMVERLVDFMLQRTRKDDD